MITFKQFAAAKATPKDVYTPRDIHSSDAVEWIHQHAASSVAAAKEKDNHIYRGSNYKTPLGLIDSRRFQRKSANTFNTYTVWVDNNPAWKNFPKRAQGLVCSTSASTARGYASNGKISLIIPSDSAKIGIVKHSDFWNAFPKVKQFPRVYDIDTFVRLVNDIAIRVFDILDNEHAQHGLAILKTLRDSVSESTATYSDLSWMLKQLTHDVISEMHNKHYDEFSPYVNFISMFLFKGYADFFDMFEDIFAPDPANLISVTGGEVYNKAGTNNEVWISGECLVISTEYLSFLKVSSSEKDQELYYLINKY